MSTHGAQLRANIRPSAGQSASPSLLRLRRLERVVRRTDSDKNYLLPMPDSKFS